MSTDDASELRDAAVRHAAEASPWLQLAPSAAYVRRGPRALARDAKLGRVRCAIVGGRREMVFRREWLDDYMESMATPVMIPVRRRA